LIFPHHLVVLGLLFVLAPAAARADPLKDTCELMSHIALGDMQGARQYWDGLVAHWDPAQRESGTASVFSALQNQRLSGLSVFRILQLEGVAEEYLAVSGFPEGGRIYFRIFFEKWDDELRLVNIRYQPNFEEISTPAFAQEPEAVSCR
jgi:hypothetical protein